MSRKGIIFDFDQTLVDTTSLSPYRTNGYGIEYVNNNIQNFTTNEYSPHLKDIVKEFHKYNLVGIVSKSPQSHIQYLLTKHGFPSNIPIIGSSSKPFPKDYNNMANTLQINNPDDILIIGDSPDDILAAQLGGFPSIGVTWCQSHNSQLEARLDLNLGEANASRIIRKPEQLIEAIIDFNNGHLYNSPRSIPDFFQKVPVNYIDPQINYIKVGDYNPSNRDEFSKEILDFKELKKYYAEEINSGKHFQYYYNGLNIGRNMVNVFVKMNSAVKNKISSINLIGNSVVLGSPNSKPEYCYALDVNDCMAFSLNKDLFNTNISRQIRRFDPKPEDHLGTRSTTQMHFDTMIYPSQHNFHNYDNVILFDDITTSNTQLDAIGKGLRQIGYSGNIYAITLGKTI